MEGFHSVLCQELPPVDPSARLGVGQGPIQRRVQFGPLFGHEFVVDH